MSDLAYGIFRARLIEDIFTIPLKPREVAELLAEERHRYPQITTEEISRLLWLGESWFRDDAA